MNLKPRYSYTKKIQDVNIGIPYTLKKWLCYWSIICVFQEIKDFCIIIKNVVHLAGKCFLGTSSNFLSSPRSLRAIAHRKRSLLAPCDENDYFSCFTKPKRYQMSTWKFLLNWNITTIGFVIDYSYFCISRNEGLGIRKTWFITQANSFIGTIANWKPTLFLREIWDENIYLMLMWDCKQFEALLHFWEWSTQPFQDGDLNKFNFGRFFNTFGSLQRFKRPVLGLGNSHSR